MENSDDMIILKYSNKDNSPILEISTCTANILTTRTLKGLDARTIYNQLKTKEEDQFRSPDAIATIFKDYFPMFKNMTWYPHGENSIRIHMTIPIIIDDGEYIFTYKNEKQWSLETFKNYKNNLAMERVK